MKALFKPRQFWVEDKTKYCTLLVIGMTLDDPTDVAGTSTLKFVKKPDDDSWRMASDSKIRLPVAWFRVLLEKVEDLHAETKANEMRKLWEADHDAA